MKETCLTVILSCQKNPRQYALTDIFIALLDVISLGFQAWSDRNHGRFIQTWTTVSLGVWMGDARGSARPHTDGRWKLQERVAKDAFTRHFLMVWSCVRVFVFVFTLAWRLLNLSVSAKPANMSGIERNWVTMRTMIVLHLASISTFLGRGKKLCTPYTTLNAPWSQQHEHTPGLFGVLQ